MENDTAKRRIRENLRIYTMGSVRMSLGRAGAGLAPRSTAHFTQALAALSVLFLAAVMGCGTSGVSTGDGGRAAGSGAGLQSSLEDLVEGFRGDVGIFVHHFETGETAELQADTLFPTASMIKVPILIKTFDAIESGRLSYRDELIYRDSLLYPGVDVLGSFRDGEKIELSKVILLMTALSDNTASLWLQQLCGGGAGINGWLATHGFSATRVNSRTSGRDDDWRTYGWGQTTPREIAELLTRIREGGAVSPAADEIMYRMLSKSYWDDRALSQIPPWVQAAAKNGAVNEARSEVVLVNAPHGAYVFSVLTNHQQDESWEWDNEGFSLIRRVSRLLWNHFEPGSSWEPGGDPSRRYR